MVCGILVPQPGMGPSPPASEAQSPKHWTTQKVTIIVLITLLQESNGVLSHGPKVSLKTVSLATAEQRVRLNEMK